MLNEACNEAQKASVLPAALMSEHKDHRQDGNNWRAAGVSQQLSVYLYTTCDVMDTRIFLTFRQRIIHTFHILKHEAAVT